MGQCWADSLSGRRRRRGEGGQVHHHLRRSSSVCEAGNRRGGGGGVGRLGRLVRLDGPCVAVKPTYLRLERRAMRERAATGSSDHGHPRKVHTTQGRRETGDAAGECDRCEEGECVFGARGKRRRGNAVRRAALSVGEEWTNKQGVARETCRQLSLLWSN